MSMLKLRDSSGRTSNVPAVRGKSAYAYAVDGGFVGTEADFAALQASIPAAYIRGPATGEALRLGACVPGVPVELAVSGVDNPAAVTVKRYGKNLLPYPYYTNKTEVNGLTFSVRTDGSILINGTATAFTTYQLAETASPVRLPVGVAVSVSGGHSASVYISLKSTDGAQSVTDTGAGRTLVTQKTDYRCLLSITAGTKVENLVVRPQIELGASVTAFAPYTPPETYTPGEDGTVAGLVAVEDTTLLTDTAGAVLTAEYVKDATTVVAELLERIAALETAMLAE